MSGFAFLCCAWLLRTIVGGGAAAVWRGAHKICVCARAGGESVCIHEWSKIQYVNKGVVKVSPIDWPSGGFVWFSQQLRNRHKAAKIPAK